MSDMPESPSTRDVDTPEERMAPDSDASPPAGALPQAAKAAHRRKGRILTMVLSGILLIVLTAAWLRDPEHREADSLSGYVSGAAAAIFVAWLIGWWVRRRGGSSYSRALDGTQDERDELIWKSAWALTGKVDWFLVLGAAIVVLLGAEIDLGTVAVIGMWINIIILYGSRFYYERTM